MPLSHPSAPLSENLDTPITASDPAQTTPEPLPRPGGGGSVGVKGPHHGVKGKGAHGNEIVTLLLESDDKEKVARKLGKIRVFFEGGGLA